jgi:hypothetical protein
MPARPANIGGADILNVINQSIREIQIRIDGLKKVIPIHRIVAATGTLNFGPIPANQAVSRNVRVAGARQQGSASASPQLDLGNAHLIWSSSILSTDTVAVRLLNPTSGPVTPHTVLWNVTVTQ